VNTVKKPTSLTSIELRKRVEGYALFLSFFWLEDKLVFGCCVFVSWLNVN
jgi:hypothetical protein